MWRRITIQQTAIVVIFLLIWAIAGQTPVDADMWWHLRQGEYTLSQQTFIRTDLFSHTFAGTPYINSSWLGQIIMVGFREAAGYIGLMLFTGLCAVAGMWFVYRLMAGNVYLRGLILIIASSAAVIFWSPRPQMITFVMSAIFLWVLWRYKYDQIDRVWILPVLMLFWGNSHAGYSIGIILLGAVGIGELLNNLTRRTHVNVINWRRWFKLVLVGVALLLVLLINPYGLDLLRVPFDTVNITALHRYIQEWQPPTLTNPQYWPFWLLLAVTPLSMIFSRRPADFTEIVLVLVHGFLAVQASRNISIFALISAPIIALHVDAILKSRGWILRPVTRVTPLMGAVNLTIIGLVAVGAMLNFLLNAAPATIERKTAEIFPVEAIEYIQTTQPEPALFNSYNWGGYLMYHVRDYPVFIDGRTDLYFDFVLDYADVVSGEQAYQPLFDRYDVALVLIETDSPLALELDTADDWSAVYEDELATVFVRTY